MFYILFFNLHSVCVCCWGEHSVKVTAYLIMDSTKRGFPNPDLSRLHFLRLGHGANQVRNTERYKNILIITNLVSISATC